MTYLSHKIELDLTNVQRTYCSRACGVARFTYNWGLAEWQRQYKAGEKPTRNKLLKQLNSIKREQFPWMLEVTKSAPQHALMNLGDSYQGFFKKTSRYPRFKKKGIHDSFRADNGPQDNLSSACKVEGRYVTLPKVGKIKMHQELRFQGRIISVVISRTADRWFASFTVEIDHVVPKRENQASAGADLGLLNLCTLSDGTTFENPKALRTNLKKLQKLSRALSKKVKGSSNRAKARMKLAKLHYRIACIRKDALHKLTSYLVKHFTLIGIETLNVKGMLKNSRLSRAIADVGLFEFTRQLTYKAALYGVQVVKADRWFPSSKACSSCGVIKESMSLSERTWTCVCGAEHDRDVNAAINLKMKAESYSVTACGESSSDMSRKGSVKLDSLKQESDCEL